MSVASGAIDAHHHLWPESVTSRQDWRPERDDPIRGAFEPHDLEAELQRAGVAGTIVMQSVDAGDENDRLFDYVAEPWVRGVVGWAPFEAPDRADGVVGALLDDARASALVGLRCLVGRDPLEWSTDPRALATFRRMAAAGLAWDIVPITPEQCAAVAGIAAAVPSLPIIVDHLASPPLGDDLPAWKARIDALAAHDSVAIKLSVGVAVLSVWSDWRLPDLRPHLEHALAAFGPGRCMIASNWPVVLLRASYGEAWNGMRGEVERILGAGPELEEVLAGTAIRYYRLQEGARA